MSDTAFYVVVDFLVAVVVSSMALYAFSEQHPEELLSDSDEELF